MLNSSIEISELNKVTDQAPTTDVKPQILNQHGPINQVYSMDEAVGMTETGTFHLILMLVVGISLIGFACESLNIGFVVSSAKCDIPITITEQVLVNSAGFLGVILSSHFWGFMADTWGRQKVLKTSSGISFICSFISSFSVNVEMLIVFRFAVGLTIAGVQSAGLSYIGEFYSNKTRARSVTIVVSFFVLSLSLMMLLAWGILPMDLKKPMGSIYFTPWRLYVLSTSLLMAVSFIAYLIMPESPKFLLEVNKKEEALEVLRTMYTINTRKPKNTFLVKDIYFDNIEIKRSSKGIKELVWNQTWPLLMPPHWFNTLRLGYLLLILYGIAFGTFLWLPGIITGMLEYADQPLTLCQVIVLKASTQNGTLVPDNCENAFNIETAMILIIAGLAFFLLSCSVGVVTSCISIRLLTTSWLLICTLATLGVVWSTNYYLSVTLTLACIGCSTCCTIILGLAADLFPTNLKAMAICLTLVCGRIGSILFNNFFGLLMNTNCETIFYIYTGLLLSCVAILVYFPRTAATTKN